MPVDCQWWVREAIQDLDRVIELDADNAVAFADRADLYAFLGRWEQAARDFRMAIRLDKSLGRAYQSAAWLMATCPEKRFRDQKVALRAAQRAIELDGRDDYRYLDTLAAAQANAQRFGEAMESAQQAIEVAPTDVVAELQEKLQLSGADTVTCVHRVKLAGEQPVAYIEDIVPTVIAAAGELRAGFQDSVLDFLREREHPPLDYARADILAVSADKELAAKLAQRPGAALLLLQEILFSVDGRPIGYSRNYFVSGHFNFHVIRRIDDRVDAKLNKWSGLPASASTPLRR